MDREESPGTDVNLGWQNISTHPQEQTGLEGSYQKPQPEAGGTKGSFEAHEFKTKERGKGPSVKLLQPPKSALFLQKDRAA